MEMYVFDNSFDGFITLIFDFYVRKPKSIKVFAERDFQPSMFNETYEVITDSEKADRVHQSLKRKLYSTNYKAMQAVFLSEKIEAYQQLFHYCCLILNNSEDIQLNYGNQYVFYVMKMYRSVYRESHHYKAFIRFEELNKNLFFTKIEPNFNILPIITSHFIKRYADQNWLIYDLIRKYGVLYDMKSGKVQEVQLNFTPKSTTIPTEYIDVNEQFYQELWKSYFKSSNIVARKNTRLHVQVLPKRFWKYLTEKQL